MSDQAARNALADTFVVRRPLRYAHLLPLSDLDAENRCACPGRGVILTLRYDDRRGGAWTISDWGTAPAPTTINGSVTSTDTQLGPFTLFYSVPVDFAFLGTPPGNAGASRLIVGDAANGDSILTCLIEITLVHAPTAIFTLWKPILLSAERAGTLVLEAASPWTDA